MEQSKRLYRSRTDRIVGGVAGGLAEYLKIDPVIIRLSFILLAFLNGLGIIIYLLMLILVPAEPGDPVFLDHSEKIKEFASQVGEKAQNLASEFKQEKESIKADAVETLPKTETKQSSVPASEGDWWDDRRNLVGLVIVLIGAVLLVNQFIPLHWLNFKILAPVVLIALGFYIIARDKK